MGAAGAQRYAEMFSVETVFSAWDALFHEALDSFQPRARPSRADYVAAGVDDLVFGAGNRLSPLSQ